MPINTKVISQLAKSTVDKKTTKKETITRGTLVLDNDGKCYVSLLENSKEFLIPATITTNIDVAKPVTVLIKNHTATVLGNAIEPESTDEDIINSTIGNHSHTWESVVGLQDELEKKAAKDHDHGDKYAAKDHTHDYSSVYAAKDHNHDDKYLTEHQSLDNYATKTYAATAASGAASTAVSELTERLTSEDQNERLIVAQSNKATQDGNGNVIANTYATKKELEEIDVKDHNHDDMYAPINHDHDDDYAEKEHNHDSEYAEKEHNHDTIYSKLGHKHDNDYAAKNHEHSQYLTNESLNDYATKGYADTQKDNAITSIEERLDSGDLIANKAVNATKATQDSSGNVITTTYATKEELKGKSDTDHNHDDDYAAKEHEHNDAYAAKTHEHSQYLTNASLNTYATKGYADSAASGAVGALEERLTAGNANERLVVTQAMEANRATYADSATKATTDSSGNNIVNTYATKNELKGKADSNHNHDDKYSLLGHIHDTRYSKLEHNHDSVYSKTDHTHDYSSVYADKNHNHDSVYSKTDHTHDYSSVYADKNHNHDSDYASKDEINNKIDSNGFKTESIENGELNRLTVTDCDGDTATILEIDVNSHMEFGAENTDLYLRGYQERPYYKSHDSDDSKEIALLEDVCVVTITDLRSQS